MHVLSLLAQTANDASQPTPSNNEPANEGPASLAEALDAEAYTGVVQSLVDFVNQGVEKLPYLVIGIVILVITWLAAKLSRRILRGLLERTQMRESLVSLLSMISYSAIWVMGILAMAIVTTGLSVGQVVATLGLGSIALGFAFKDIIENFFAGILILWKFPFDNGDFIACQDIEGRVEDIEIRQTLIRRTDGQLIIVPNAMMFKNPVRVITADKVRRITVDCGIAYGEDVATGRKLIREAVESCSTVESDKPVEIFANTFGDSAINFEVTWWTGSSPLATRESADEVVEAVKKALDDAGIEIPYPYRTLTFSENEPLISDAVAGNS